MEQAERKLLARVKLVQMRLDGLRDAAYEPMPMPYEQRKQVYESSLVQAIRLLQETLADFSQNP